MALVAGTTRLVLTTPAAAASPSNPYTAVSTHQYTLSGSDGSTWTTIDSTNLVQSITPGTASTVVLSGNADLFTNTSGYNQDLGITVSDNGGGDQLLAWKESGGFAGTFSPNAAFVQAVYNLSAGHVYTFRLKWKTNRAAPSGVTIYAGAGTGPYSPTRLTGEVLPTGASVASVVSTSQYILSGSDGSTWASIAPTTLVQTINAGATSTVVLGGNADLWTDTSGYNQDLAVFVSDNGGADQLLAWKESGGSSGTYSPNAAFIQSVYGMTSGHSYTFKLKWKTNRPQPGGAKIYAGAGSGPYSPTRLSAEVLSGGASPFTAVSSQQYSLSGSDGTTWRTIDATNLAQSTTPSANSTVMVSGNVDLFTNSTSYNQDVGIFVSDNGGPDQLLAWKESGGFGGIYSPDAAFVQTVYQVTAAHTYSFRLKWKTNKPEPSGVLIYAAAGSNPYSPTRLTGWYAQGVSDPPQSVTAVAASQQATVTWQPPWETGGAPLTGYTITPQSLGGAGTPVTVPSGSTSATITGLTNGVAYTFAVVANNSYGSSLPATSNSVTARDPNLNLSLLVHATNLPGLTAYHYGFLSGDNLPAMSSWTIEGYIWDYQACGITSSGFNWGSIAGTPSAPGGLVAGINVNTGGGNLGSSFVWPGGSNPLPSVPCGGPLAASGSTPAHYALSYDGTTVRGFVNGALIFEQASSAAALPAAGAGFIDNNSLNSGAFDEMRFSNVARYTAAFSPQAPYVSDAQTIALYHFDDYHAVTRLPPLYINWNNTAPLVHLDAFDDSSGNGHHLAQTGWSTGCVGCSYYPGPTYHPYSIGQGVTADESAGGGSPWQCLCHLNKGQPVDTGTGEFWHTLHDLTIPGRGISADLSQTYSSHRNSQLGPLGYGWTMDYRMGLSVDGSGSVTVVAGNGSTEVFQPAGSGAYSAPPLVLAVLVKNGDGTYTLTDKEHNAYRFNSGGRLVSETDRNGYVTSLSYNASGLATVTDPAGRTLTFTYANSLVQSVADSGGRSVGFSYDANSNLVQLTDVAGGQTKFTYDSNHLLLTMKDPNCSASTSCTGVTNVYDGANRVTQQTDDMGRVTKFTYNADGTTTTTDPNNSQAMDEYVNGVLMSTTKGSGTPQQATWTYGYDPVSLGQTRVTDPNGNATNTTRDSLANILTRTDAISRTHTYTYNAFAEVMTDTDPLGVTTTNTYDARGNLTSTSRPLTGNGTTQTTALTYGDATHPGDVTQMVDPDGKAWSYGYDQYGDRVSATDPQQDRTTSVFDSLGRMTSTVSPKGNAPGGNPATYTTNFAYNPFGDVTSARDPLGRTTVYSYDSNRNRISMTDANLNQTRYAYDADDELIQETRPDGSTVKTGYDNDGNVLSQTDGLNNATTYTYDALDRRASMADPLSRQTTYAHDGAGNLTSMVDPLSQTTSYSYDPADELTGVTYSDGVTPHVTYTYDADGQRTSMVDGTGTSTYAVDSLHRLTQMTNGAGLGVSYGYDLKSQLTSLTYPGGTNTVSRTYDGAGRLKTVADWLTDTTTYTYDANSNLTGTTYPNSTSASQTYDAADQLIGISDTGPSGQFLSLSYTRDQVGQITAENASTYGYDSVNRLNTADNSSYGYDAGDNLLHLASGQAQAYDAANEVCWTGGSAGPCATPPSGATTYSYDARGDRTQRTAPGSVVTSFAYDEANRLSKFGSTATYLYNGDGVRAAKTVSGVTTQQTWNIAEGLPLLIQDGSTRYVTGAGGLPLEQISGSTVIYYHHDQLGSTRALTSQSGAVIGTATYDAYGEKVASTGTTSPFQYAGQYRDNESGLYYLRARYYDPSTGQFISRDPAVALTREPYAYTKDNPLNGTDPTGLDCGLFSLGDCVTAVQQFADQFHQGVREFAQVIQPFADANCGGAFDEGACRFVYGLATNPGEAATVLDAVSVVLPPVAAGAAVLGAVAVGYDVLEYCRTGERGPLVKDAGDTVADTVARQGGTRAEDALKILRLVR